MPRKATVGSSATSSRQCFSASARLQRLREKVEITRHLIEPDRTVIAGPKGKEKQAAFADASSDDDQMQLSLLPL
ncbi:hypothetical protein [Novosphingobium guangzhouense]|uniref:Uncharacterized protein n=1 Tax=Novosphingobium guangzhouense TaxID=1850347 RepID=A0A2K2FY97_9SPHN|nr:hypothetical protein [Novosphingobium guangzhouense]PNU03779.1 hypothetical protein A8V01_22220 [Novosphingobium guangzhouense]